ncbi:hypothetical protein L596_020762 [Steinernema carpocapsae]|uniref:Neurotransmitter-gated ion-channel ligand-binding domain-containing protein n=1 Tax=Steinernema carpocapsae TaxID=34508 RepID=A0A4U5MUP8_STECR|nr:hypothetical protein L596_020762 [Steinernema carpocapsae]
MFVVGSQSAAWLCALLFCSALLGNVFGDETESEEARGRRASSTDLTDTFDASANCLLISTMLNICLSDTSLTYDEVKANLSLTFIDFFKIHAFWKSDIRAIEIDGFGSLDAFLNVAVQFNRIANFWKLFVMPPGETDCELVIDLTPK